ncbi:hypothetical protein [Azonexus sp.]|uniref:hypothetical protein n=1 Tax=Azonexus sp. TaxID=1872668 RepID=UPI0035AE83BE
MLTADFPKRIPREQFPLALVGLRSALQPFKKRLALVSGKDGFVGLDSDFLAEADGFGVIPTQ